MAAREDDYESARLFAQQNRVTRLLYTLRDMNEFGLVVDFNRLQLVREIGEDHCGRITQRKFVNGVGIKTPCVIKRLLKHGIPMELNLRAIITAPPRYQTQQTQQTYKSYDGYTTHHSVSKHSVDSAAHAMPTTGSAIPSRHGSPGLSSRPGSPPRSRNAGGRPGPVGESLSGELGLPMLASLSPSTQQRSRDASHVSHRSPPDAGLVFGFRQETQQSAQGTHDHLHSRDSSSHQHHSQYDPSSEIDRPSVDVDPQTGSLRPVGGHAPPRPPPNNVRVMRNMLSDTQDEQDEQEDEDPFATPIPNHENSCDRAASLNAASSEEHSPPMGESVETPTRGRHVHSPRPQDRPGSPPRSQRRPGSPPRTQGRQISPPRYQCRRGSPPPPISPKRQQQVVQQPIAMSEIRSASLRAASGRMNPMAGNYPAVSGLSVHHPSHHPPSYALGSSYTAPAPISPMHSQAGYPVETPGDAHEIPDEVRRLFSKLPEEEMGFVAELGMLRSIFHPHLVQYLGCGINSEKQADGTVPKRYLSIAQEWCDGESLESLIAAAASTPTKGKRLYSYHDAWRWVMHTAEALQYLHDSSPQVVHRDLKPSNMILSCPGRLGDLKVTDYGLTSLYMHASNVWRESNMLDHRFLPTQRGCSLLYLAPEVVDIFSLAVIMYELLMMTPMVCLVSRSGTDGELVSYANCVALGYRESFKKTWPDAVQVFFSK